MVLPCSARKTKTSNQAPLKVRPIWTYSFGTHRDFIPDTLRLRMSGYGRKSFALLSHLLSGENFDRKRNETKLVRNI